MNKTSEKCLKDQTKIVVGVVLTQYPFMASEIPKMTKFSCQIEKKNKKNDDNVRTICTSSDHDQTSAKFQKDQTKTVGRVAITKHPLIVSTDGQINKQTIPL